MVYLWQWLCHELWLRRRCLCLSKPHLLRYWQPVSHLETETSLCQGKGTKGSSNTKSAKHLELPLSPSNETLRDFWPWINFLHQFLPYRNPFLAWSKKLGIVINLNWPLCQRFRLQWWLVTGRIDRCPETTPPTWCTISSPKPPSACASSVYRESQSTGGRGFVRSVFWYHEQT